MTGEIILITILLFGFGIIIEIITNKNDKKSEFNKSITNQKEYKKKNFMTAVEYDFYSKMKDLEEFYKIIPQVNLATIIDKTSNEKFRNELFRNIDFAIFTKDYSSLLLLIELNDQTHNTTTRKKRDKKVKEICEQSSIPLITFYTKYPNEKEYVINRVLKEINNQYNQITVPPLTSSENEDKISNQSN